MWANFVSANNQNSARKKIILYVCLLSTTAIYAQNTEKMSNKNNAPGQVIRKGKLIYSEITVHATPQKVWGILTDFSKYPSWNPFIKSFKGQPVVGKTIEAHICPPGAKGMTFKPEILQYKQNEELRWIGKLFVTHLFDGEHTFLLRDNNDGTTTLMQFERFRGILVPIFKKMLDVNTQEGFKQMNEALKQQAEQ